MAKSLPLYRSLKLIKKHFTYLVWVDCSSFLFKSHCRRCRSSQVSNSSNKYLTNSQKGVHPVPFHSISIGLSSEQENNRCNGHGNAWNSKSKTPIKVLLNRAYYKMRKYGGCTHSKIPPIKEWTFQFAFFWVLFVKLIGTNSLNTRPLPTLREYYKI